MLELLQNIGPDQPLWILTVRLQAMRLTGTVEIGDPVALRLFARDGEIYAAERPTDPPLEQRLIQQGVLTAEQVARGTVHAAGTVSLARLARRDSSVDRDVLELTVLAHTEQLLEELALTAVGRVVVHPLRHHPAGIHHWFADPQTSTSGAGPSAVDSPVVELPSSVPEESSTRQAETPWAPTLAPHPASRPTPRLMAPPPPQPFVPLPTVAPVAATPPPPSGPAPSAPPPSVAPDVALRSVALPSVAPDVALRSVAPDVMPEASWPVGDGDIAAMQIWEMVDIIDAETRERSLKVAAPATSKAARRRSGRKLRR